MTDRRQVIQGAAAVAVSIAMPAPSRPPRPSYRELLTPPAAHLAAFANEIDVAIYFVWPTERLEALIGPIKVGDVIEGKDWCPAGVVHSIRGRRFGALGELPNQTTIRIGPPARPIMMAARADDGEERLWALY